jgi:hypothetical protein
MRQPINVPKIIESKVPRLGLNRSSSNISAGPQSNAMQTNINLLNLKEGAKKGKSKYEDNIEECQRLA